MVVPAFVLRLLAMIVSGSMAVWRLRRQPWCLSLHQGHMQPPLQQ
jgi:hypothetical protein